MTATASPTWLSIVRTERAVQNGGYSDLRPAFYRFSLGHQRTRPFPAITPATVKLTSPFSGRVTVNGSFFAARTCLTFRSSGVRRAIYLHRATTTVTARQKPRSFGRRTLTGI